MRWYVAATLSGCLTFASDYAAPAGERPAIRRPGAASILPGGRVISPLGTQYITGPGPFGVAMSSSGKTLVTANSGPERFSVTVIEKQKDRNTVRHLVTRRPDAASGGKDEDDWHSVFMGIAFDGEKLIWASEGNSGRVRQINLSDGSGRRLLDANVDGFSDSFTGDLALDPDRHLLHVVDQANFRLVTFDLRSRRAIASVRLGRLPFALALSPDRRRAYVTNLGMFEYRAIPGAEQKVHDSGLSFPAFGFPSSEARDGTRRETARGSVDVPGLGDPNAPESNSLAVVNLENPAAPRVEVFVRTGLPVGPESAGGSSPSGVVATADRIFVSNAHQDSITAIDARTNAVVGEIPLRVSGLENLRGLLPLGLAVHEQSGWLLVAEAVANAVGVVDIKTMKAIGHLPTGWFPTRVLIDRDTVYVTNAKGHGTGPNAHEAQDESFIAVLRRGTLSMFPIPAVSELPKNTGTVFAANGWLPRRSVNAEKPPALPPIRHVVLIVKEGRAFDEVFGDIREASNGPVGGAPTLARFGSRGFVDGGGERFSLQRINVTPNHHALAERYAFSDNFYADGEISVDGHHWLAGSYPNAWTESSRVVYQAGQKDFRFPTRAPGRLLFAEASSSPHPEALPQQGSIWHHLARHDVTFRNYGEGFELAGADIGPGLAPTGARFFTNVPVPGPLYSNTSRRYPGFNMNIPDQYRAAQFIEEIGELYAEGKQPLPRFLFIHLPNDHMTKARPEDGYPYEASYLADNDYALGRIIEFLSRSPWWRDMAVFVTEAGAEGGRDHIDAHRTVLLGVGPYFKRNYVSHVNTSFPGLLKTIFGLLGVPPLNLFDAVASDLSGMFASEPDFTPYELRPVDPRLFDPAKAREPLVPRPSPSVDQLPNPASSR